MTFAIFVTRKRVVIGCLCAGALVAGACTDAGRFPTSPSASAPVASLAATAPGSTAPSVLASFPRSGSLHVTKECSKFATGSFCTITSSNLEAIEVGSRIVYLQPADLGTPSGSDVVLDPPGPGNNAASGHCALDPQNNYLGLCTFAVGTGKFTWFHARVNVSHSPDFSTWYWEGTYSFDPRD